MVQIIIASILLIALVIFVTRVFPRIFPYVQQLMRNPVIQAMLLSGLWRLIKRIILRR